MMRRDWWLALTCVVVLLVTACGRTLPAESPTDEVPQELVGARQPDPTAPASVVTVGIERYSHGGPVRDHVSFVDHLRGKGYQVEPVADVRQPFLRAEGTVLRVSGGDLNHPAVIQSYNYDDTDLGEDGLKAAKEDASKIGPGGQPRTMSVLWKGEPHFFRKERVLVLYLGEDKAVLDLLTDLLGPQFAGGDTGETACATGPQETMEQPPLSVLWEFWPQTLAEAEERATVVVIARVTGVESTPEGARRTSFGGRRVTLEVMRSLQGTPDKAIRLFWAWTEEQYNEHDPPYRPCEEYVLFLEPKTDEKGTYLVVSPLGRYRVEEGKLQPVAKQAGDIPVPSWVRELRGKSVGYLEKELANAGKGSPPATVEDLADFGTSEVQVDGQVNEPERRAGFVRAYCDGKPARWKLVAYTQEGDPVSYELRYAGRGKAVVLIRDSTRDKHDSPQVVEYECGQLMQKGEMIRLLQCAGDGKSQDIALPWKQR